MGLDCNPPDIAWYASSAMCGVRWKATVLPATRGFRNRFWQTIPHRLDYLSLRFANIRVHDANLQIKRCTKELLHFAQHVRVRRVGRARTDSALGKREMDRHLTVLRDIEQLTMSNAAGDKSGQNEE